MADSNEERPRRRATRIVTWSGGIAPIPQYLTYPPATRAPVPPRITPVPDAAKLDHFKPDAPKQEMGSPSADHQNREPGQGPTLPDSALSVAVDEDAWQPDEEEIPWHGAGPASDSGESRGTHEVGAVEQRQAAGTEPVGAALPPAPNPHLQMIVEVVGALGVIDMTTALALCQATGGASRRHYTTLMANLEHAGVLRQITSASAKIGAVIGRSYLLTPGEKWHQAVEALGAEPAAAIWEQKSMRTYVERMALMHLVVARVVEGWTLVRGKEWIAGVGALDRNKRLKDRAHIVAKSLRAGYVTFANPLDVWGFLPPDGTRDPALLVGYGAIRASRLDEVLTTAQWVAPLEIVCVRRSKGHVEQVRRLVRRRLAGKGDSSVTVFRPVATKQWRERRREFLDRLSSAVGAEREVAAFALRGMLQTLLKAEAQGDNPGRD